MRSRALVDWLLRCNARRNRNPDHSRSEASVSYVFRDPAERERNPPLCHAYGRAELCTEGEISLRLPLQDRDSRTRPSRSEWI